MLKHENYTISGAKGRLISMDLTYRTRHKHSPLIIFAHGFKGFKDWGTHHLLAEFFAEHGFRFLKFNFSHNGVTADQPTEFADLMAFGENTFSMELEDLGYVINFACGGSGIPVAKKVILIGHSLGGGISIIKAAEDSRISHLITMAAVADFHNLWKKEAEAQWRIQGTMYIHNARTGQQMPLKLTMLHDLDLNAQRLNIMEKAAEIKQPWLIVHGDKDPTVALKHAQDLETANPAAEVLIIPHADHVLGATHPYLQEELPEHLLDFCKQSVSFLQKSHHTPLHA